MTNQEKVDEAKALWEKGMSILGIPYEIEEVPIERADQPDVSVNGYCVSTDDVCGCIIYDFGSDNVGYLVLDAKLLSYYKEEGLPSGTIEEKGKCWIQFSGLPSFMGVFVNKKVR